MKQEYLLHQTSALKLFITNQSKVRLEYCAGQQEFELIEEAIEFVTIHPELFSSAEYDEFFAVLQGTNK
jgi:hypothetical protein